MVVVRCRYFLGCIKQKQKKKKKSLSQDFITVNSPYYKIVFDLFVIPSFWTRQRVKLGQRTEREERLKNQSWESASFVKCNKLLDNLRDISLSLLT